MEETKETASKNTIEKESPGTFKTILNILIIFFLIVLCLISIYAGYIVYREIPGRPENLNVILTNSSLNNEMPSEVKQFNANMKFNHNDVTYEFFECKEDRKSRMTEAFNTLSASVGYISFKETNSNPDIEIICSEKNQPELVSNPEFFIAGEGGAKEVVQTGRYNVITNGSVLLYGFSITTASKCKFPNVELHELVHVFGFDHSSDKNSLMYPYLISCEQKLDDSIINELKRLYSEENLPDLYFENFTSPVKKGKYLDLNFTIKNSGTRDAPNATFSVVQDGKIIEAHELGDIKFGAGIFMKIENLKLSTSNPSEIKVVIDLDNNIKEMDKKNNVAQITF